MSETTWLAALLLGLAGGGHCAGMCGGIVGAISRSAAASRHALAYTCAYHGGRALSYALAVALVLTGSYLAGYAPFVHRMEALGHVLWRRIEPWSRPLFPVTTAGRAFALGVAWGWLPCGMVSGALLLALASGSALSAVSTMLAFALGTLPSLLAVGLLARFATLRPIGPTLRRVAGAALVAVGLYGLIHAGMNSAMLGEWCRLV